MSEPQVKSLYVLHGRDAFRRDEHRRSIVAGIIGEAEPELAVARFDASAELAGVLDELRTPPLLTPHRAVILSQADKFVTDHVEALTRYLAAPSPSGSLVLLVDAWKSTSRAKAAQQEFAKLDKAARKVGDFIDCSAPADSQLPAWIAQAATRRGKTIARDGAGLLAAWTGADLARLDSEVEKLSLYVGPREQITLKDVATVVAATTGPTPFALPNAIAAGQTGKALKELAALMTTRGEEFRVLGLIAWQLRRSGGSGKAPSRGAPRGRTSRSAKARRDFRSVLAADLALKSGADAQTTMQLLVTQLCL